MRTLLALTFLGITVSAWVLQHSSGEPLSDQDRSVRGLGSAHVEVAPGLVGRLVHGASKPAPPPAAPPAATAPEQNEVGRDFGADEREEEEEEEEVPTPRTLHGRLIGAPLGQDLSGVRVAVRYQFGRPLFLLDDDDSTPRSITRTDAEGGFEFPGLPASEAFYLALDMNNLRRLGLTAQQGQWLLDLDEDHVQMRVYPTHASTTGRVIVEDHTTEGDPGPTYVRACREDTCSGSADSRLDRVDPAGHFELEDLPDGTYSLYLYRGKNSVPIRIAQGVRAGSQHGPIRVPETGAPITGRVWLPPELHMKDAVVTAWPSDGLGRRHKVKVQSDGSFTVNGPQKGASYRLELRLGYGGYGGFDVVEEARAGTHVRLSPRPAKYIRFVAPGLRARITVTSQHMNAWVSGPMGYSLESEASTVPTRYTSYAIASGRYTVECRDFNGNLLGRVENVEPGDDPLVFRPCEVKSRANRGPAEPRVLGPATPAGAWR